MAIARGRNDGRICGTVRKGVGEAEEALGLHSPSLAGGRLPYTRVPGD